MIMWEILMVSRYNEQVAAKNTRKKLAARNGNF